MLTANDLAFMIATENAAMGSTGVIHSLSLASSPLGFQSESYTISGTVNCDVWPIPRFEREKSSGNQELSKGEFYISVPYNTTITVKDRIVIDSKTYEITFVPLAQTWLTNLRLEARNYNGV